MGKSGGGVSIWRCLSVSYFSPIRFAEREGVDLLSLRPWVRYGAGETKKQFLERLFSNILFFFPPSNLGFLFLFPFSALGVIPTAIDISYRSTCACRMGVEGMEVGSWYHIRRKKSEGRLEPCMFAPFHPIYIATGTPNFTYSEPYYSELYFLCVFIYFSGDKFIDGRLGGLPWW